MLLSRVVLVVTVLGLAGTHAGQSRVPQHGTPAVPREASTPLPAVRGVPGATSSTPAAQAHGRLPLVFEANHGQAGEPVRFLARGRGYSLFLTSTEAAFVLSKPEGQAPSSHGQGVPEARLPGVSAHPPNPHHQAGVAVLRMQLVGAAPTPRVVGLDELPGTVNYFIGRDPALWRTNIPTYARVKYENVYPGIDLVYYGNQRQLEYDFMVAPGADPRKIALTFKGAERLDIDPATGDLIVRVSGGTVRQKKPFVYQERDGVREAIHGAYVLKGPHQVGFLVAAYDVSRFLVIDPQLVFSVLPSQLPPSSALTRVAAQGAASGGSPWPMYGHDSAHTGRSAVNGPTAPEVAWTYSLGVPVRDNASPAIGPDGTVYVPSETGFFAVNPDGTLKWKKWGAAWYDYTLTRLAPAIAADGTVYVSNLAESRLYALDPANGATLWSYPIRTTYGSPTVGPDGTIYIGSAPSTGVSHMYALNSNGTLKWDWSSGSNCWIESSPAIGLYGEIYFQHNCLGLVALDTAGNLLWSRAGLGEAWNSPSVAPDGTVYIGTSSHSFYALNPDGTTKWQAAVAGWMYQASASISRDGSAVYRGDNSGIFYAFDSAGAVMWRYDTGITHGIYSAPALSANGVVYFTQSGLYAVRASDGTLLWKYEIGPSSASPALGADGTLYAVGTDASGNGVLYAFRCPDLACVNQAPNGSIDAPAGDVVITVGQSVLFQGTGADPDGHLPLSYRWTFGGSGIPDSTAKDPGLLTFTTPGTFTVALTVTDALGLADGAPATRTIRVWTPDAYSTHLGGRGEDHGLAIAVDDAGNAYVAGVTGFVTDPQLDFPTTGGFRKSFALRVAFVTKLDASGSLVYSTLFGGDFINEGTSIAVDRQGNAYVTGRTTSRDFPTTEGAFQRSLRGFRDAFVTKLNASGSALLYSTYLGGDGWFDTGMSIAVDAAGNAHVAGSTDSTDFPQTFQTALPGFDDRIFAVKLNSSGSGLIYSTLPGDSFDLLDGRVAVDAAGNAYVAGRLRSSSLLTTAGAFRTERGETGSDTGFILKLDPDGTVLYSTYFPGGAIRGLAVDPSGSAYVTGSFDGVQLPLVNPIQPAPSGGGADFGAFVAKLNPTGSALVYSTLFGGFVFEPVVVFDKPTGIAVDSSGNAYVTGFTEFPDFPTTRGAFQTSKRGPQDAFLTKLDVTGTVLLYSTYLGGDGSEGDDANPFQLAPAIAVDHAANAYLTGSTNSTNFPTTAGAFQTTFRGGESDAFVAKIDTAEARIPLQFVTFPASLPSLPTEGRVGVPYVGNIGIGGGRPPYEITIVAGALPPGLSFGSPVIAATSTAARAELFGARVNQGLGSFNLPVITGIPTLAQVQAFLSSVQVRDALGSVITRDLDIAILPSSLEPSLRVVLPAPLVFGSVLVGASAELTLTVSNPSGGTLEGSVAPPPGGAFSVMSGGAFSLGPGQSQTVVVRFSPAEVGAFSGSLQVTSNGGDDTRPLTGTGAAAMPLTVATTGGGLGVVRSDLNGIDCEPRCSASYSRGSVVTLTAMPTANSMLAGWTGGGCGTPTDTCTVVMDEPQSVTAMFMLRPPDLIVSALRLGTSTRAPGQQLRVTATVENRSPVAALPSVTRFYLSADAVRDPSDRLLSPAQRVPALAPGKSATRTTALLLPRNLVPGTYTLLACADAPSQLVESDESNNCLAAATPLGVVGPDLVVDEVMLEPASVRAGASLGITAVIRNQGTARSERSTTRYYLSAIATGAGDDRLPVGSRLLGRLAPGATARTSAHLRVPPALQTGSYFVLACVDDLRLVVEAGEANNCRASPMPIQVQGR